MVIRPEPPNAQPIPALRFQHPQIQEWPIKKLRPATRNARTHPKKQTDKIISAIRRFGFINPLIIEADGTIIAGHLRYKAAKLLQMTRVPVILIKHLSHIEKRAFALAENRISLDAGTDRAILAQELSELAIELPKEAIDLSLTGYDAVEIEQIFTDSDEAKPDRKAEQLPPAGLPVSLLDDVWLLGKHRLLCGDALSAAAFKRLMGRQSAAMAITAPPFDLSVRRHGRRRTSRTFKGFPAASGEMGEAELQAFLSAATSQISSCCADGAIIMQFIDWAHVAPMLAAAQSASLQLKDICVWVKSNSGLGTFYRSGHELVCVFKRGAGPDINNFELGQQRRSRTNVWRYSGPNAFEAGRDGELKLQPGVKPVQLVVDAILDCSRRDSIILDPFIGSGTTIIAGETVGRRVYGMELEPDSVDLAVRRWQKFTGRDAVLESKRQTFAEIERKRNSTRSSGRRGTNREERG